MAKVSEALPCAPGGPESHFIPYRPRLSVFDPMRFCAVRGCSQETAWLVNDGLSRLWQPRCAQHKLFGVTVPKVKLNSQNK